MPIASRAVRRLLSTAGNTRMFWPLMRSRATILMLHRFRAPELGVEGHDPQTLRRALTALRRERFGILPLTTLSADLVAGRRHERPAVAFTIDDGYLDHATVAAPVFAEFDCPVTTFVTTGFLDAQLWFWWDRIEYVFESTNVDSLSLEVGGHEVRYAWRNDADRRIAQHQFTELCKELMDTEKNHAVERLALAARVDIPALPPLRYAPMTWSDLR